MPSEEPTIGILSGMGPYAGLDLAAKIHRLTRARTDQEHLPVALLSCPGRLPDRSAFLLDSRRPSPVPALVEVARRLEAAGATVIGVPCNTAHAPPIFDALRQGLRAAGVRARLLHMIEETVRFVAEASAARRVGVLSSLGVYRLGLYRDALKKSGFAAVRPDEDVQTGLVTPAIFDAGYGIKAQSAPVTPRARAALLEAVDHLKSKGADAVVLGCTELPLALPERAASGLPLIDPTTMLARALIRATYPEKLKPLPASPAQAAEA